MDNNGATDARSTNDAIAGMKRDQQVRNDAELMRTFGSGTIEGWKHRKHVRMGYLLLRESAGDVQAALDRWMYLGAQYNARNKIPQASLNRTVTAFWLIRIADEAGGNYSATSEAFWDSHAGLHNGKQITRHYNAETIAAGRDHVERPNLDPIRTERHLPA